MDTWRLKLSILDQQYAVCQIQPGEKIPDWVFNSPFFSATQTYEELSLITEEKDVPEGIKCEKGWACIKLEGTFEFSLTGVLTSIANPLAAHGISIFALSTFNTDYVLVKKEDLGQVIHILEKEGHHFIKRYSQNL